MLGQPEGEEYAIQTRKLSLLIGGAGTKPDFQIDHRPCRISISGQPFGKSPNMMQHRAQSRSSFAAFLRITRKYSSRDGSFSGGGNPDIKFATHQEALGNLGRPFSSSAALTNLDSLHCRLVGFGLARVWWLVGIPRQVGRDRPCCEFPDRATKSAIGDKGPFAKRGSGFWL